MTVDLKTTSHFWNEEDNKCIKVSVSDIEYREKGESALLYSTDDVETFEESTA